MKITPRAYNCVLSTHECPHVLKDDPSHEPLFRRSDIVEFLRYYEHPQHVIVKHLAELMEVMGDED